MHPDYLTNIENSCATPASTCCAYDGDTLERDGMAHEGHDMVVLDKPTPAEEILARDLRPAAR